MRRVKPKAAPSLGTAHDRAVWEQLRDAAKALGSESLLPEWGSPEHIAQNEAAAAKREAGVAEQLRRHPGMTRADAERAFDEALMAPFLERLERDRVKEERREARRRAREAAQRPIVTVHGDAEGGTGSSSASGAPTSETGAQPLGDGVTPPRRKTRRRRIGFVGTLTADGEWLGADDDD